MCKLKVVPMQGIPKKSSRQAMTDWLNATTGGTKSTLKKQTNTIVGTIASSVTPVHCMSE
ncbi:MAG: hypothetical protein RR873_07340 [Christensenella sp.]